MEDNAHSCSPVIMISSPSFTSLSIALARFSTACVELDAKPISSGDAAFMRSIVAKAPSETRFVLVCETL